MSWENIIKKDFSKQKKLDLSLFFETEAWVNIKKLSPILKKQIFNTAGVRMITEKDENGNDRVIQEFTEEYKNSVKDNWRLLFENCIDTKNHGMDKILQETGFKELNLSFWEALAENLPECFEYIENEINKYNSGVDNDPKLKKKLNMNKRE